MHDIGLEPRDQATLRVLTEDVIKTSEIKGDMLNPESVRSSIARRLGVDIGEYSEVEAPTDHHVDGVVDMVLDAPQQHDQALTVQRLCGWHAALFPTGYSGMTPIRVGAWRNDAQGTMHVVSGTLSAVLGKANFWRQWADTPMNERQIKLLNKLLDGFDGKLTTSKWAAIAKCSQDTALRDINELLERGVLMRSEASGRSTSYEMGSLA
jgi:Fic family protein